MRKEERKYGETKSATLRLFFFRGNFFENTLFLQWIHILIFLLFKKVIVFSIYLSIIRFSYPLRGMKRIFNNKSSPSSS